MILPRVLVFDPDPEMLDLICVHLRDSGGLDVVPARSAKEVLERIPEKHVDLLITGSKVPETGLAGFVSQALARMSAEIEPLVLVISDPGQGPDLLTGRTPGRILFLPKPFDRAALLSMVRSNLKIPPRGGGTLHLGKLSLNPASYDVHLDAERLHLTSSEFKLLFELMSNPDVTLSRDHLIQKVQGEGVAVVDRAVDTHVFSLRKKLGKTGERIETVRGLGYRLRSGEESGQPASGMP